MIKNVENITVWHKHYSRLEATKVIYPVKTQDFIRKCFSFLYFVFE